MASEANTEANQGRRLTRKQKKDLGRQISIRSHPTTSRPGLRSLCSNSDVSPSIGSGLATRCQESAITSSVAVSPMEFGHTWAAGNSLSAPLPYKKRRLCRR